MLFFFFLTLIAAKNIILSNDDGFTSTNIRATYYKLKDAGHNVFLVAAVSQRSGWGGKFDIPSSPTLETNGEFGYIKAGSPSWGHEVDDDHIWYFNGSPASCVAFALDYVLPIHFGVNSTSVDMVVAGPNEGTNMSPGLFTLSGTMGATYTSVYRGIAAISCSGSNSNNSFFEDSLDLKDNLAPSTIYAGKVVEIVDTLFQNQGENQRVLPLGVGLNVNFPKVGYESVDDKCVDPIFKQARLTGMYATVPDMKYNATSNSFSWTTTPFDTISTCSNGDCTLPSENLILGHTYCQTSVSVFGIDYDANEILTTQTEKLLTPLFNPVSV